MVIVAEPTRSVRVVLVQEINSFPARYLDPRPESQEARKPVQGASSCQCYWDGAVWGAQGESGVTEADPCFIGRGTRKRGERKKTRSGSTSLPSCDPGNALIRQALAGDVDYAVSPWWAVPRPGPWYHLGSLLGGNIRFDLFGRPAAAVIAPVDDRRPAEWVGTLEKSCTLIIQYNAGPRVAVDEDHFYSDHSHSFRQPPFDVDNAAAVGH